MASSNNQRQGTLTSGWKTTVRVALATGATVATLIGTQVLALADQSANAASAANTAANTQTANSTTNDPNGTLNTNINDGPVYAPADSTSQDSAQANAYSTRQRQTSISPASNQPAPYTRSSRRG